MRFWRLWQQRRRRCAAPSVSCSERRAQVVAGASPVLACLSCLSYVILHVSVSCARVCLVFFPFFSLLLCYRFFLSIPYRWLIVRRAPAKHRHVAFMWRGRSRIGTEHSGSALLSLLVTKPPGDLAIVVDASVMSTVLHLRTVANPGVHNLEPRGGSCRSMPCCLRRPPWPRWRVPQCRHRVTQRGPAGKGLVWYADACLLCPGPVPVCHSGGSLV